MPREVTLSLGCAWQAHSLGFGAVELLAVCCWTPLKLHGAAPVATAVALTSPAQSSEIRTHFMQSVWNLDLSQGQPNFRAVEYRKTTSLSSVNVEY